MNEAFIVAMCICVYYIVDRVCVTIETRCKRIDALEKRVESLEIGRGK